MQQDQRQAAGVVGRARSKQGRGGIVVAVRLVLVLLALILALGVAEVGARIIPPSESTLGDDGTDPNDALWSDPAWRSPPPRTFRSDPVLLFDNAPSQVADVPIGEAPGGRYRYRANGYGLRRDTEIALTAPPGTFRTLVLGDSQTGGYVDNTATYPQRLENVWKAHAQASSVEVLNAGVIGYAPQQEYLWYVQRGQPLHPNLVILALYVGNDMRDMVDGEVDAAVIDEEAGIVGPFQTPGNWLSLHSRLAKMMYASARTVPTLRGVLATLGMRTPAAPPSISVDALVRVLRECHGCWLQTLKQSTRARAEPEKFELAYARLERMVRLLDQHVTADGGRLAVMVIPSKPQVEPDDERGGLQRALRLLDLDQEAGQYDDVSRGRMMAAVRAAGVPLLDPLAGLQQAAKGGRVYYRRDWHLNARGNEALGAILDEQLRVFGLAPTGAARAVNVLSAAASPSPASRTDRCAVDAGRSQLLATLLPTLLAALVFILYFRAQPHWLADPDAQDYAQAGRQLAAGRGPTTRFMPWNGLDYLVQRGAPPLDGAAASSWPNIVRFPLTPSLMAASFLAFGPGDEAVHLPAGLAFVLTAGCAGLLGARVYGVWAGLAAGLTAAFLPLLVNYSLTGLTEPLLGLLILGTLACVVRRPHPPTRCAAQISTLSTSSPARRGGAGRSPRPLSAPERGLGGEVRAAQGSGGGRFLIIGGALFGLAILNRYDTALLALPILVLWLLPRPDRLRASLLFLAPSLVVVLPWAIYLTAVAGAPLFNLQPASIAAQASGRADGLGWYLPEYVSPADVWLRDPARALRTASDEIAATPDHLRKLLGWPWLLAGSAACLLSWLLFLLRLRGFPGRPGGGGLLLVAFLLVAVLLRASLASVLGLNLQRHFVPLVPLLLVIVAGEAIWLVSLLPSRPLRIVAQAAVTLLLVLPGLLNIWPFLVPPAQPPGPPTRAGEVEARPENLARLGELVGPGQLVASNVPWSVAWQADRHAVPLPPTVEATAELERRFGISIDAIYVAGQVAIADAPRSWRVWDELRRRGAPPPGYVLADSFANGGRLFVKSR